MGLKLSAPIEKDYVLEKTDRILGAGETTTTVRIRQATMAQNERRATFFQKVIKQYEQGGATNYIQDFNVPGLMRTEAMLTVIESDLQDENGKPMFFRGMTELEFTNSWNRLPPLVAEEIHEKVLESNPDWQPAGE